MIMMAAVSIGKQSNREMSLQMEKIKAQSSKIGNSQPNRRMNPFFVLKRFQRHSNMKEKQYKASRVRYCGENRVRASYR